MIELEKDLPLNVPDCALLMFDFDNAFLNQLPANNFLKFSLPPNDVASALTSNNLTNLSGLLSFMKLIAKPSASIVLPAFISSLKFFNTDSCSTSSNLSINSDGLPTEVNVTGSLTVPPVFENRIFTDNPERGDVAVF